MHLIGYMDDLNTVSWPNLKAYMSLTGVEIPPGECRLIIKLSMEQQKMLEQAKQLSCPAPYQPDDEAAHDRSERIVGSFTDRFKSK